MIDCVTGLPDIADWRAVLEALDSGGVVAFPTETVYGVGVRADLPAAVERLRALKGERGDRPFALLVADASMAVRLVAPPPAVALRLMRMGWPGPLTLVLPARGGGTVGLRCPDHPIAAAVAALHTSGLSSSSANRTGAPAPTTAAEVTAALGDDVAVVLDGGPARLRVPSTVLRIDSDGTCALLREGAFPRDRIARAQYVQVLFVCTGNTCRSPMAAGLLRRRLAQSLGVTQSDLPSAGFVVESAGTGAFGGAEASAHAVEAARERGADLRGHRSRAVTPGLLEESDRIVCMTRAHRDSVLDWVPAARGRVRLLHPAGDLEDPVGGTLDEYRRCAGTIEAAVEALAAELLAERPARGGA